MSNTRFSHCLLTAMVALGFSTALQAADGSIGLVQGQIGIVGAISANTCAIDVNGSGSNHGTVVMPPVTPDLLVSGMGRVTLFTVVLSHCLTKLVSNYPGFYQVPIIRFRDDLDIDHETGWLLNKGSVTNIKIQLFAGQDLHPIAIGLIPHYDYIRTYGYFSDGNQRNVLQYGAAYRTDPNVKVGGGTVMSVVEYRVVYP